MITFIFRFMTKENCALYSAYFSVIYKMVLVSKSGSSQTNSTTTAEKKDLQCQRDDEILKVCNNMPNRSLPRIKKSPHYVRGCGL